MDKDSPHRTLIQDQSYATVAEALEATYHDLRQQHGDVKRRRTWKYGFDYQRVEVEFIEAGGGTVIPLHLGDDKRWRVEDPPGGIPLYRHDEIVNADQRKAVLVVQGEPCVNIAREIDFTATTNAGDDPLLADWSPLTARRVVLWRDNDQDGVTWQTEVVEILNKLDASVAIIDPPDGIRNIGDYIKSGRSIDHVQRLIDTAEPVLTPQERDEPAAEMPVVRIIEPSL